MATFTLPNWSSPEVTVRLPDALSQDQLLSFRAFKDWLSALQKSLDTQSKKEHTFRDAPYRLRKIDVQAVDFFGKGRIGFLKLQAVVENDQGEKLPGSVFLRGGSVGMLLILQSTTAPADSESEKYVILTVQPRIAAGSLAFSEIPAGMLDDSGTFAGGAAKEIEEETGLKVPESELVNLTELATASKTTNEGETLQQAIYPSPGGCDEFIPLFLWQKRVEPESLKEWQGKLTGLREDGEKITLKLVRLEDLWREGARDAKTLCALALYDGLRREMI